jgi:hypothetical protein
MAAKSVTTMDASASFFTALPDDLLQRVLVGVPFDDHRVAASVCQAFRGVINGPRFPALRQRYGFAERAVVTVRVTGDGVLDIVTAHNGCILASIPGHGIYSRRGTTDGGTRLFLVSKNDPGPSALVAVDVSSRRWKRLPNMPQQHSGCIEWHRGLLYVAGGWSMTSGMEDLNSLHAFNVTTGSWEELPRMPHACTWAASGVIGNQLFIAGGDDSTEQGSPTLQIYDIASRTWRMGASLPDSRGSYSMGYVVDGKLCVMNAHDHHGMPAPVLVYDPQSDTWTEQALPPSLAARLACVHDGRLVMFQEDGTVDARGTDGYWFPYTHVEPQSRWNYKSVSGSVLLG